MKREIRLEALVAAGLLLFEGCRPQALAPPEWLRLSRACAAATTDLHTGKSDLRSTLAILEECRGGLGRVPAPATEEVATVLRSGSETDRLAGLLAMSEKGLSDDALVSLVLSRYSQSDGVLLRIFGIQALNRMRADQVGRFSEEYVRALRHETNPLAVVAASGVLDRLPAGTVADLAAGWTKTGDFELQVAAYDIARRLGLVASVRRLLMDGGAQAAVEALNRIDKGRSRSPGELP